VTFLATYRSNRTAAQKHSSTAACSTAVKQQHSRTAAEKQSSTEAHE